MKARIRKAIAWARSPEGQRAMHVGVVSLGGSALVWLLKDNEKRFRELEERGLMPVDDFATVGDVYELDNRVRALEGKPPRPLVIDVEPVSEAAPEPPPAPVEAPTGAEGAQEGLEGS
jgi:hypothetical protein